MSKLTPADVNSVKGKGFLRNRGTDNFSGRMVAVGTVFSAEDFKNMSELAEKFGNGKLIPTSRLSIEIPGIAFQNIPAAIEFAAERNLYFGGTGPKVRPIAACKGTTCVFGNCDTHKIAADIHNLFYLGWNSVTLPHKFKIAVGGCPNSCMKPSINDFGIEGHKIPVYNADDCKGCPVCAVENSCSMKAAKVSDGKLSIDKEVCLDCGVCIGKCPFGAVKKESKTVYKIYVGGTWGKHTRMGTPLSRYVTEEEILPILEKSLLWFRENAFSKERFGLAIDRIGADKLEEAIFSDDLLSRKEEILSAEIKTR